MTSIAATELRKMLKQVAPCMSDDDTLPVLNAINLEARDGYLFAVTSDRYTIAVSRTKLATPETWRAMIPGSDLDTITSWLKRAEDVVDLTIEDANTVTSLTLTCKGSSVSITTALGNGFPQWRTILRSSLKDSPEPVPFSTWTTSYLARWKHGGTKLHVWQTGPNKPMILADNDGGFIGMQMPVRDDVKPDELAAQWLSHLTPLAYSGGREYRLDTQWSDKHGDPWEYTERNQFGEPLMRLVGIDGDDHTLGQLIRLYGPITPRLSQDAAA